MDRIPPPPQRANPPFSTFETIPMQGPSFPPPHEDPSMFHRNNQDLGRKRNSNNTLDPLPPLPQPSASYPYYDPYGAYRNQLHPPMVPQSSMNSHCLSMPKTGGSGYPTPSKPLSKKRMNHSFPISEIGSPVSGASFSTTPSAFDTPPPPLKIGKMSKSSSTASSSSAKKARSSKPKVDSKSKKKMRRRRDVDWRVRNDEQAYQKVLRNRQAAARSNEKRRRVRQQYDKEIGGLLEQKDSLMRREQQLKEENRNLKARVGFLKKKY